MDIQRPRACEGTQWRTFEGKVGQRVWKGVSSLFSGVSGNEVRHLCRLIPFHWKCRTLTPSLGPFPSQHYFFLIRSLFTLRSYGALTYSASTRNWQGVATLVLCSMRGTRVKYPKGRWPVSPCTLGALPVVLWKAKESQLTSFPWLIEMSSS